MFDFHGGLSFPVCLDDLCGAVGGTFLHDGHSLQKSRSTVRTQAQSQRGDKIFEQIYSVEMWSSCYERGLGPEKEKKKCYGKEIFKVDVKNEKMKF